MKYFKLSVALLIVVFLSLSLTSCMTVHLNADGVDKQVNMTGVGKKFQILKHFNVSKKGVFMIFDLITVSNPDVSGVIRDQLKSTQGDAVINLRITGQTEFIDGLVSVALGTVGGLVAPPYGSLLGDVLGLRTYTIEGDVVKILE
jgi:hypothetical protein